MSRPIMGIVPCEIDPDTDLNETARMLFESILEHVDEETALKQLASTLPVLGGQTIYMQSAGTVRTAQREREARTLLARGNDETAVIRTTRLPARTVKRIARGLDAEADDGD